MANELTTSKRRTIRRGKPQYVTKVFSDTGALHYELTDKGLAEIAKRARQGHGIVSIAAALGISRDAFRDLRKRDERAQEALDIGRDELGNEISDRLLRKARKGEIAALAFFAKTRLHWRETGPVDPNTVAPTVNINITAPLSDDEFSKMVEVKDD